MDCPRCGEPLGVATLFCQCCGARLAQPAQRFPAPNMFDRGQWAKLPPYPASADRSPLSIFAAVFDLLFGFLQLL
jgi:hypothetical protein